MSNYYYISNYILYIITIYNIYFIQYIVIIYYFMSYYYYMNYYYSVSNSVTSQGMSRIAGRHQELGEWHEMNPPLEASEEPMC